MLFDSHYWMTYALLAEAGYAERAHVVAWANQMVDWATPEHAHLWQNTAYPVITQSYEYAFWRRKPWVMQVLWARFHGYLPWMSLGEMGKSIPIMMCVRKDWVKAVNLIDEDPFMAGIQFHTLMDSVAHASFVPTMHKLNRCPYSDHWRNKQFWTIPLPRILHAQYGTLPDEIDAVWYRHGLKIVNREKWGYMLVDLCSALGLQKTSETETLVRTPMDPRDRIKEFKAVIRGYPPYKAVEFKAVANHEWRKRWAKAARRFIGECDERKSKDDMDAD